MREINIFGFSNNPIFKKGKKNDLNNCRHISVFLTVAKIFEKQSINYQPFSYFHDKNFCVLSVWIQIIS